MIPEIKAYWDRRPCNIRHSPRPVGSRWYFWEVAARRYFVEPHILLFADFAKWRGKRVLEIGCGIGTDGIRFALSGADYTGIDLSPHSLRIARDAFKMYGCQGRFYEGNAEELEYILPPEKYDLIYAFGVLHHTPNPERVVAAVREFMGPESEFRLMLYSKYSWKSLMILLGLDQSEAQSGCPLARRYSYRQIRKLLKGFRIVDMHKDHIFQWDLHEYLRYEYKVVPWFGCLPRVVFYVLKRWLGWHTLIGCVITD